MNSSNRHETAKIYAFPRPGTAAFLARRGGAPAARQPEMLHIEFGSSWYHESAVREAERTLKPVS